MNEEKRNGSGGQNEESGVQHVKISQSKLPSLNQIIDQFSPHHGGPNGSGAGSGGNLNNSSSSTSSSSSASSSKVPLSPSYSGHFNRPPPYLGSNSSITNSGIMNERSPSYHSDEYHYYRNHPSNRNENIEFNNRYEYNNNNNNNNNNSNGNNHGNNNMYKSNQLNGSTELNYSSNSPNHFKPISPIYDQGIEQLKKRRLVPEEPFESPNGSINSNSGGGNSTPHRSNNSNISNSSEDHSSSSSTSTIPNKNQSTIHSITTSSINHHSDEGSSDDSLDSNDDSGYELLQHNNIANGLMIFQDALSTEEAYNVYNKFKMPSKQAATQNPLK